MNRIAIAFRAFFAALFSQAKTEQIRLALQSPVLPKTDAVEKKQPEAPARDRSIVPPARSDAVTLLAALQREARFVDLVKQPLGEFSDEQIGAAARNVLGDCAGVLDRFFALQPLVTQEEGSPLNVPQSYDAACYKLSGRVEGSGPFHGKLVHHGWKATTAKLPAWTGSKDAALIIAPAEIEVS
jgi:uncharacterized protein DUF2760